MTDKKYIQKKNFKRLNHEYSEKTKEPSKMELRIYCLKLAKEEEDNLWKELMLYINKIFE